MRLLGRPIGVWIATAYLLALVVLAVIILTASISSKSFFVVLALMALLSSVVLMLCLNRWAVLTTAVLAALQAGSYLGANQSHAIELLGSPNIVYSIQCNFAPLMYLAGTFAVLLYTTWLWRMGVLT